MLEKELERLNKKFKQNEVDSLSINTIPDNKYLCIRLDGFKATKKYLKDSLTNERFNNSFYRANQLLFNSFKHYLTREYTSSIVCSLLINDELSVILNKDNNEDDSKKIMKLCTLFAGNLSSAMTLYLNSKKQKTETISFDARPILLDKNEISEYIRYRYLISKRYAYWKVLRLKNIGDWVKDDIKYNIDNCINKVKQNNLEKEAFKIIASYRFYLPSKENEPQLISHKLNDDSMNMNQLKVKLNSYLGYLHSTHI